MGIWPFSNSTPEDPIEMCIFQMLQKLDKPKKGIDETQNQILGHIEEIYKEFGEIKKVIEEQLKEPKPNKTEEQRFDEFKTQMQNLLVKRKKDIKEQKNKEHEEQRCKEIEDMRLKEIEEKRRKREHEQQIRQLEEEEKRLKNQGKLLREDIRSDFQATIECSKENSQMQLNMTKGLAGATANLYNDLGYLNGHPDNNRNQSVRIREIEEA